MHKPRKMDSQTVSTLQESPNTRSEDTACELAWPRLPACAWPAVAPRRPFLAVRHNAEHAHARRTSDGLQYHFVSSWIGRLGMGRSISDYSLRFLPVYFARIQAPYFISSVRMWLFSHCFNESITSTVKTDSPDSILDCISRTCAENLACFCRCSARFE